MLIWKDQLGRDWYVTMFSNEHITLKQPKGPLACSVIESIAALLIVHSIIDSASRHNIMYNVEKYSWMFVSPFSVQDQFSFSQIMIPRGPVV